MSLVDADKNLDDRSNPALNADDNVLKRDAHETIGTTYRRTGSNVKPTLVLQQGTIQSYDANGLVNMFFGYKPSLSATRPVLRIAKDGFDATTTDSSNLVFNSENNVFKIVLTGTTSITAPVSGASSTVTVTHNLGFVPIGMFYVNNSNQFVPLPWTLWGTTAGKGSGELTIYVSTVDSTTLIFQINNWNALFAGVVYPIKYYLLQETAN